jgi:hypothetical protein
MQTANNYELFPNLQAEGLLEQSACFFLVINVKLAVPHTIPENVFKKYMIFL